MYQPIKIKVRKSEIESLCDLLNNQLEMIYKTRTDLSNGERLVFVIMHEIQQQLQRQLANAEQKRYTLKLSHPQAYAFMMYFNPQDLSALPYESFIIRRIYANIDQSINN